MTLSQEEAPRRSDATRAAILDAARHRFAADGFQKATIRAIAADAGIDPSMVMRYYGNKDGLFAAAVDVNLGLADIADIEPDRLGETLMRHALTVWEHPPASDILLTLMRSSITDDRAIAKFQEIFARQVMPAVLRFGNPDDAPRRAGLLATQVLGVALTRYVLKLPPVVAMTPDQLVTEIGPTIQRYLTSRP
ncbi:MAG TPA: TetR family transcriptional regulator [Pseudonocardiaceae bacterium]|jgi:AcrR family transcriptional regulator